jgi:hypothetical protein
MMAINAANLILCNAVYEDPTSHNITLLGIFTAISSNRFPTPYRLISAYTILKGLPGETGEITLSCTSLATGTECARERQRIQIGEFGKRHLHVRLSEFRFPEPGEYVFSLIFDGATIADQELLVLKVE